MSGIFDNAAIISRYTRLQAIDDGILVDLMQEDSLKVVKETGFTIPVAITAAAFELAVWPILEYDENEEDNAGHKWLKSKGQSFEGRLWDVLYMLRCAIRRKTDSSELLYMMSILNHRTKRRQEIILKSVCGPNDDGSPCLTIMLPEED